MGDFLRFWPRLVSYSVAKLCKKVELRGLDMVYLVWLLFSICSSFF